MKLHTSYLVCIFFLTACNAPHEQIKDNNTEIQNLNSGNDTTQFVPKDSANKMISSYLNSIDFLQNDTDVYSFIYDADSLRKYLDDTNIKKIKIIFAHTLEYINNGGQNKYCGYESGKLNLVIAGYDINEDYVYHLDNNQYMVIDRALPCPSNCPVNGTAASNFLD